MADSVETWIDALCKVWAISDGRSGAVRSFLVFEKNELPGAITSEMVPCAVSYPSDCEVEYSMGGPTIFWWNGTTEFHLTRDVKPANLPYILPFYGRIAAAAMSDVTLGDTVGFWQLQGGPGAMQFATFRALRDGLMVDDHQGILVRWRVKQTVSGQYTVSA